MHSSRWQYLGYMLVGVGSSLYASGAILLIYFRLQPWLSFQYQWVALPLLVLGFGIIVLGILTFYIAEKKKRREIETENPSVRLPSPRPPTNHLDQSMPSVEK